MPRTGPKYLRRTNRAHTCRWCGRSTKRGYGMIGHKWDDDGKCVETEYLFCSKGCTEDFAVAAFKNGMLLKPYEGEP